MWRIDWLTLLTEIADINVLRIRIIRNSRSRPAASLWYHSLSRADRYLFDVIVVHMSNRGGDEVRQGRGEVDGARGATGAPGPLVS